MPVDSTREMERTPISTPESLRVRCPHCRKLYLVQYSDIQESKPRFECMDCHGRFWISLPDMDFSVEVDGLPIHAKEAPTRPKTENLEPCPKCHKMTSKHRAECAHCGVVMAKFKEMLHFKETGLTRSPNLETLWRKVIANYEDSGIHDEFIATAEKENNLGFAAAQYGQMKKIMPFDEITISRIKQLQAIATSLAPETEPKEEEYHPWRTSKLWQVPLVAAGFLIVVGLTMPGFRNFAGLGAAFLFIALVMRRR